MPACNPGLQSVEFSSSLPANTPVKIGKRMASMKKAIEEEKDTGRVSYILFTNVEPEMLDSKLLRENPGVRITYDARLRQLITKLPDLSQETARAAFGMIISITTYEMGILRDLAGHGAGRFKHPSGISKEPESSWAPYEMRPGRIEWPSMILECGCSDSIMQLRKSVGTWITTFECQVAIIISISRSRREMTIEKWVPPENERPGIQTRASSARSARPLMSCAAITIRQDTTTGLTTVQNDPLVIAFEEVWLRPISGSNEHDYIIQRDELEDLGDRVWHAQDMLKRQA